MYKEGDEIVLERPIYVEPYATLQWRGFLSIGAFSYTRSHNLSQATKIGRFCSLAERIKMVGVTHPLDRVSTHTMTYWRGLAKLIREELDPDHREVRFSGKPKPVTIGNDVWIADDVLLGSGIHIGDGAVIGARSVVTKDVPPYSFVAGSPAVVRKMRFDETTVERLRNLN